MHFRHISGEINLYQNLVGDYHTRAKDAISNYYVTIFAILSNMFTLSSE